MTRMTPPQPTNRQRSAGDAAPAAPWTVRAAQTGTIRSVLRMREAQIMWAMRDGRIEEAGREIPAMPLFLDTCSAMARGALVACPGGAVAVEDLMPGDMVETVTGGAQRVLWKGAILMRPGGQRRTDADDRLYRIPADTLGQGRPAPDLLLGGGAMVCVRTPEIKARVGSEAALVPIGALADGSSIFPVTPAATVEVFHIALASHHILRVNGVEIESFHPGSDLGLRLPRELVGMYLALFPHLNGGGFGPPRMPRLSADDLDDLSAA